MPEKNILSAVACPPKRHDGSAPAWRTPASRRQHTPPIAEEKRTIRVAVADPEGIFRMGLKSLLASDADLEVVAEIDQPGQLVSETTRLRPDVVFVQVEMLASATGALAEIREGSPSTKLVVTASALAEERAVALVEAGAQGAILKTAEPALFAKCAHKVAAGEIWLPKKQVAEIARRLSEHRNGPRPVDTLTTREKAVISCLVQEGWRNRDIAQHLSITEQTVKNHLRSIYDKVGVSDRVELVLYAFHQHLDLPSITPKNEPQ
jgi:two-component system, NarL family, nitrate/nitrite response regulator NarL